MTTTDEDFFHALLDLASNDSACRFLLREWLDDRGDVHAIGYGWMATHHKYPEPPRIDDDDELWTGELWGEWPRKWNWWLDINETDDVIGPMESRLDEELFSAPDLMSNLFEESFSNRQLAERALCRAILDPRPLDGVESQS